jgi:uncharacterized protein
MVATEAELEQKISDFIERLERAIRVEAVILFGSYAHGTPHKWSDIDLAVISPNFEGLPINRRQEVITENSRGRAFGLAPIGYPSSAYHNPAPHSFLREIIRTGRVVYRGKRQ